MIMFIMAIIVCFFIGSVPFGYILGRCLKNIDLRRYGSGNIGATNVLRTVGRLPGVIVLFFDILKGFIAVTLVANCFYNEGIPVDKFLFVYVLGIAAIIGHDWTIFLKFKGGKGVSTTLGVLLGISFIIPKIKLVLLILVMVWVLTVLFTRFVSLGSVLTAVAMPVAFLVFGASIEAILFASVAGLLIIIRHKDNLKRLFNKEEKKLNL